MSVVTVFTSAGLAGKDAWEEAKVDEFADFHKDVFNEVMPYVRAKFALLSIYAGDAVGGITH